MHAAIGSRTLAGIAGCATAIALASSAVAQPGGQVPGNGVFRVGTEIEPGTYRTQGPSTPLVLVFGDIAPISFCSWSTHSTLEASNADVVDADSSLGPMYAKVSDTVAAFKTENCQPWTRVS